MGKNVFKKAMLMLVVATIGLSSVTMMNGAVYAEGGANDSAETLQDNYWLTVTMHAGEHGYFGQPGVTEKTTTVFEDDVFMDETVPDSDGSGYAFAGWVDNNGNEVTVYVNSITRDVTDLYATWSNQIKVTYFGDGGYFIDPETGEQESNLKKNYSAGEHFISLTPISDERFEFEGWYTENYGEGDKYTEETLIEADGGNREISVRAHWRIKDDAIDAVVPDVTYHVERDSGSDIFSFTPTKNAYYKIYTIGAETNPQSAVQIFNADRKELRSYASTPDEQDYDCYLTYEFEAGKTYYVYVGAMLNTYIKTDFRIEEFEPITVTLHANVLEGESAYFDGDPTKMVKQVQMMDGDDIVNIPDGQYNTLTKDSEWLTWNGWSTTPDGSGLETYVHDGMDLYVRWNRSVYLTAYANGGFFVANRSTELVQKYVPSDMTISMDSFKEPRHSDLSEMFLGWATTPDATEPDIIPNKTTFNELPNKIYAVYSKKVHVTLLAPEGGYFYIWEDLNRVGMAYPAGGDMVNIEARHVDTRLRNVGYTDQNGVDIYRGTDEMSEYKINEDSIFTVFYGIGVYVNANGGYFPNWGTEMLGMYVRTGGFKSESIYRTAEKPINETEAGKTKYIVGWATTPDATEPDIIEGETDVEGLYLSDIYAIWGDDEYVIEGEEDGHKWTRGSTEGLRIVVHRVYDDDETFRNFTGIAVDGEDMISKKDKVYDAEKGSLILTLKTEYLESLEDGEHELVIFFAGNDLTTSFVIVEPEEPVVPNTGASTMKKADGATLAGRVVIASMVGAVVTLVALFRYLSWRRNK